MKKIVIYLISGAILITSIYLIFRDERVSMLKKLDSEKVFELYYFKEFPFNISSYDISGIINLTDNFNEYTKITEHWVIDNERISEINYNVSFNDTENLTLENYTWNNFYIKNKITVLGAEGYYSSFLANSFSASSFLSENIIFAIEGSIYQVEIIQRQSNNNLEIPPLGDDYLIRLIEGYFTKY